MPYKDYEKQKEYLREYVLKRYHRRMAEAKVQLGGKCVCGSTDNLEFDHIESEDKIAAVGKMWSYNEKKFQEEIAKCQLLCHDCHRAKHFQSPCS